MYFRDAAELQLAPAGGSPPRELAARPPASPICARRHGRLVLRRAAADRRAPARPRARCRSRRTLGSPTAGTGSLRRRARARPGEAPARLRRTSSSPKTTRPRRVQTRRASAAFRAAVAGERAAHESTSSASASAQRSACSAGDRVVAGVEERAEATRAPPLPQTGSHPAARRTRGRGSRVRPRTTRRSTSSPEARDVPRPIASRSDRTVLLCSALSRRKESMATLTWLGHAVVPARYGRRQAHLHRSVPAGEPEDDRTRRRLPNGST